VNKAAIREQGTGNSEQVAVANGARLRELLWWPLYIFAVWAFFDLVTKFAWAWMEWYRAGGLQ